jgi:hypothetical protein
MLIILDAVEKAHEIIWLKSMIELFWIGEKYEQV